MITKYGYMTLGIITSISIILVIIAFTLNNHLIRYALIIVSVLLLSFSIYFFRDPDRVTPQKENVVISPADGKIIIFKQITNSKFFEGNAWQLSIFMSPLDVHVNRIPITGTVDFLNYVKGDYLVAFHEKADERNERSEIGIKSKYGKVLFTQVAGLVARRIVYEIKIGDTVQAGNRFGMIKFGSRADVIVPEKWMPKVKLGDVVTAGETILYEYPD